MAICFSDHYTQCDKQKKLLNEAAGQGGKRWGEGADLETNKVVITVNALLENIT